MTTLEAGNALEVAKAVTERLPENTSQTALKLYRVLLIVAIEITRRRGQSPQTCEAVFHLPLELVAEAAGVSRVTAWRHLRALRELGLVDNRLHKASCRGETRNSGSLWRVRMSPLKGSRARVSADDLRHAWRDLDADVRRGRTSQRALKHTRALESRSLKTEIAIQWALSPGSSQAPVNPVCFSMARRELESVLDVTRAPREERGAAVDEAAHALALALRDSSSLNWYRKLLWNVLRRYDSSGEDFSYAVYLAAQRARTDNLEGFARRPGALFVSRIKAAPWWSPVWESPPNRVGSPPLSA